MEASEAFEAALRFCLKWEGGYVNDPDDPGGETKFGISKRAYPYVDIKALTREQAAAIYRRDYWTAVGLDSVADTDGSDRPLFAIAVFDTAVNLGPLRAKKIAQQAAGTTPDGIWGPLTRKAFRERSDELLVEMLCFYRRQAYRDIVERRPASGKFLKGWMRRVDELQEFVRSL